MADTPVNNLMKDVLLYQYNPAGIQRAVLQKLTEASNGELEVVDPTNPFTFALEAAAVLTAASMMKNETNTRKLYPIAAQDPEDLYLHMSDRDYIDRFASPAKTKFKILISKEELLNKMVLDPDTGMRKLVIPRNTVFTVADIDFSLQYPIEIRQPAHGGIQVVYNVDIVSPLQALETNLIDHELRRNADGEWLFFEFDVYQFSIISQTNTLNAATEFKHSITLEDEYYYTRVYVENAAGGWDEIRTTHTDQVYDVTVPTAVLRVVDKQLTVSIPQIYTSTQMLNRSIRIDAYQTKGPLNMLLSEYPINAFSATWLAYDVKDNDIFSAPLKTFRAILPFSDQAVTGGKHALSFVELRQRVIENAIGAPSLPITNVQIKTVLQNQGYSVVKNIDNITNRVFQATKEMPQPANTKLITAAAASIETITISAKEAILIESVIDNNTSITITPDTLYQNINGIVSLVPTDQVRYLLSLPVDKRALAVTDGNYLYTPFHYVLDMSGDEFDARAYYLDAPEVETKLFVAENDTTLIQVNTQSYAIVRTTTGYQIQIVTGSGDAYKELDDNVVHVQLAYVPAGEKNLAYLNGVLVGKTDTGERIYTFDLSTNFNVDSNDNLQLTQFVLYSTEPRLTGAGLRTEFDIVYSTSAILGAQWQPNQVDQVLGRIILPGRLAGITHEKLRVKFGDSLETLWTRSRSMVSGATYKTWEMDVPYLYDDDVYVRDVNGSAIQIVDGQVTMTLLHKKGDPVLDDSGAQVYRYRKGDIMVDGAGNPVPVSNRDMLRQVDVMLIEGVYWFATDVTATGYRSELTQTVVSWLTSDLAALELQLLEKTEIYFYPKTTMGTIDVLLPDNSVKAISAGQSFRVALYVTETVYNNSDLREQLTKTTVKVISDALKDPMVSIDAMTNALRAQYGSDVMSVMVSGLGGADNLQVFTVTDESTRCSIRKRLAALPDDTLIVEEDVTVDFAYKKNT